MIFGFANVWFVHDLMEECGQLRASRLSKRYCSVISLGLQLRSSFIINHSQAKDALCFDQAILITSGAVSMA